MSAKEYYGGPPQGQDQRGGPQYPQQSYYPPQGPPQQGYYPPQQGYPQQGYGQQQPMYVQQQRPSGGGGGAGATGCLAWYVPFFHELMIVLRRVVRVVRLRNVCSRGWRGFSIVGLWMCAGCDYKLCCCDHTVIVHCVFAIWTWHFCDLRWSGILPQILRQVMDLHLFSSIRVIYIFNR
jgi:hypothetical protein